MEQKCQTLKKLEQEINIIKKMFIGIIVVIIFGFMWYILNHNKFLFYNVNGRIDMSIVWTAIGSIGSIFAFIGVIVTIKFTENSRIKQNKYEFQKEKMIQEQIEFKKELRTLLDESDPICLIQIMGKIDKDNLNMSFNFLMEYNTKIKYFETKLYWYYDKTIQGQYMKLSLFIQEFNNFKGFIEQRIKEYEQCIFNYRQEVIKLNEKELEKMKTMNFTKSELDNREYIENVNIILEKIKNISIEIVEYINNGKIQNLYELAKDVCIERNNVLANNLLNLDED